ESRDKTISLAGEVMGTPAYMAPEQAAGHHDRMDTRSDVFSLGVILYNLLLGQSPHDLSGTMFDVLQGIREGRLRRPREVKPSVPLDLEAVLIKALALDMDDRYLSAGDLADDVQALLEREPVRAQVPTRFYVLRKKARKYTKQLVAGAIAAVLLVSLGLYGFSKWVEHTTRLHELEIEARKGNLSHERLKWTELELKILGGDKDEARASLRVMRDRFILAQEQIQDLADDKLKLPPRVRRIDLEKGSAISPKALVHGPVRPPGVNGWSLDTVAHRGPVFKLLGSPDGRRLASVGFDLTLRVWDMEGLQLESIFVPGSHMSGLAWSPDGVSLMAGHRGRYSYVTVWDREVKERVRDVQLGSPDTRFLTLSCLGKYVALPLDDVNAIQIWDMHNEQELGTMGQFDATLTKLAWSSQDRFLAVLESSGRVSVWDLSDRSSVYVSDDPNRPVTALAWLPKRDRLSLVRSGQIELLEIPSGVVAATLPTSLKTPVDDLVWSSTGSWVSLLSEKRNLFMRGTNGSMQSVHVPHVVSHTWVGDQLVLSDFHGSLFCVDPVIGRITQQQTSAWCGPIQKVRMSPSEDRVALLASNGMVSLWDMYTWEAVAGTDAQMVAPNDFALNGVLLWSPSGDELVSTDATGSSLVFRDSRSLQRTRQLSMSESRIGCADCSVNGLLAVGTEEGDLHVYRWSQMQPLSRFKGHEGGISAVTWLPSGQTVVTAGEDQTIRFWDVLTGQCTMTLNGHDASISDLILDPNQGTLTSIDASREILVWDILSGTQVNRLTDDLVTQVSQWSGPLTAAARSPDGTMLAVAEARGGIQIWNPTEKNVIHRQNTKWQHIRSLAWSPDNRYLLAGTNDAIVHVWDIQNNVRKHVQLMPLSGSMRPGIAITDEGDYRGPPGIEHALRYIVNHEDGCFTWHANEFYVACGWINEPWQVGMFQPGTEQVQRLYVRADAQGPFDGLTWRTAFNDLQDALSRATEGTEIWVVQGIYRPDRGTRSRTANFSLPNGVRVYGGFTGNESSIHHRDPEEHKTVLSGDLLVNDRGFTNNDENSFHVVVAERPPKRVIPQDVLLDGFIISGGNASENREDTQEQRRNQGGGGAMINTSRITLQNCVFMYNAAFASGGGLSLGGNGNIVQNCRFIGNSSSDGGGMSLRGNDSRVSSCVFERNQAERGGGLSLGSSNSIVVDCQFTMNKATNGGAIFGGQDEGIALLHCLFVRNHALQEGGAWAQSYTRMMSAQNCLFVDNSAGQFGGGLASHGYRGRANLEGCGFVGNSAVFNGGAIMYMDSKIRAINCSFVYNVISGDVRDKGSVGGIYHKIKDPNNDTALVLSNCILWGNSDHRAVGERAQLEALNIQVNNSCIEGWTGRLGGVGNFGDDPQFADLLGVDGVLGTLDDQLHLRPTSPCIDRGDSNYLGKDLADMNQDEDANEPTPFDLRGFTRVFGPAVDIGACEMQ
ncbi:choice-of-anchor Q domain-containing protein, partial [Planctomycetota bacterium]